MLPGVSDPLLLSRGNRIVVLGAAKERETSYGLDVAPLLKDALQPTFGGGRTDAYLMLVEAD